MVDPEALVKLAGARLFPPPAHSGTDGDHESGDSENRVEDVLLRVDHQAERMVHGDAESEQAEVEDTEDPGDEDLRRLPDPGDEHPEDHDPPDHVDGGVGGVAEQPARRVRVQPRSSRTECAGLIGDELKVRVAAPPVDGAANDALVGFLADRLRVARAAVVLLAGASSRSKLVEVRGLPEGIVRMRLGVEEN